MSHRVSIRCARACVAAALLASCGGDDGVDAPDAAVDDPRQQLTLEGDRFFPEGIAINARRDLFVGSLSDGRIVKFTPEQTTGTTLVPAGSGGARVTVGMIYDEPRKLLWACASDPAAVPGLPNATEAVIKAFDPDSGALVKSFDMAPATDASSGKGFCNDLALDDRGNLYATDFKNPRVLRVAAADIAAGDTGTATDWKVDPQFDASFLGLNGIAVRGSTMWVVNTGSGKLLTVSIGADGAAGAVTEVALGGSVSGDGLKARDDSTLYLVTSSSKLERVDLTAATTGTLTTVRDGLDGPTTFVFDGNSAWVVLGQLGRMMNGTPNLPFSVVRVAL